MTIMCPPMKPSAKPPKQNPVTKMPRRQRLSEDEASLFSFEVFGLKPGLLQLGFEFRQRFEQIRD